MEADLHAIVRQHSFLPSDARLTILIDQVGATTLGPSLPILHLSDSLRVKGKIPYE